MIIGITGGIGAGKSLIARELAQRDCAVYDCDREAKRIIAQNREVQQQIIALLGPESFADGQYNTAYVARRVFADPQLLARLNAIVHPAVQADIQSRMSDDPQPLYIESAILYESGLDRLCSRIIVVDAPVPVRIARVIARDYNGVASEANINKVRARIQSQTVLPVPAADPRVRVLNNDGQTPVAQLVDAVLGE